jgi:hypothetical protein
MHLPKQNLVDKTAAHAYSFVAIWYKAFSPTKVKAMIATSTMTSRKFCIKPPILSIGRQRDSNSQPTLNFPMPRFFFVFEGGHVFTDCDFTVKHVQGDAQAEYGCKTANVVEYLHYKPAACPAKSPEMNPRTSPRLNHLTLFLWPSALTAATWAVHAFV